MTGNLFSYLSGGSLGWGGVATNGSSLKGKVEVDLREGGEGLGSFWPSGGLKGGEGNP